MEFHTAGPYVYPCLPQAKQKVAAKQDGRRGLHQAADGVSAQPQCGDPKYHAENHNHTAGPPMDPRVPPPQRRYKLQWNQQHEEQTGHDVQQSHPGLRSKVPV